LRLISEIAVTKATSVTSDSLRVNTSNEKVKNQNFDVYLVIQILLEIYVICRKEEYTINLFDIFFALSILQSVSEIGSRFIAHSIAKTVRGQFSMLVERKFN